MHIALGITPVIIIGRAKIVPYQQIEMTILVDIGQQCTQCYARLARQGFRNKTLPGVSQQYVSQSVKPVTYVTRLVITHHEIDITISINITKG